MGCRCDAKEYCDHYGSDFCNSSAFCYSRKGSANVAQHGQHAIKTAKAAKVSSHKKFLKWRRENYPLLETKHEESQWMERGWNAALEQGAQNPTTNTGSKKFSTESKEFIDKLLSSQIDIPPETMKAINEAINKHFWELL